MTEITQLDLFALHFINQIWTSPFLDSLFTVITDLHKQDWVRFGLLPLILGVVIYRRGWRGPVQAAVVMALTIGASDFFNHRVVKHLFDRDRPFVTYPQEVTVRLPYVPGGKSFPSNHATNMAATARLISAYVPSAAVVVVGYSVLVAYSRPYLGVHYPSDVIVGWLWGWLLASVVLGLISRYRPTWGPKP